MKKFIAVIAVALFTTGTFAQDAKTQDVKADQPQSHDAAMKHQGMDMYTMRDGKLMRGMGDTWEAQTSEVTLRNGTVVMPNGDWKSSDGKSGTLEANQCIDMMGKTGDCGKMMEAAKNRKSMDDKKMDDKKMEDKK